MITLDYFGEYRKQCDICRCLGQELSTSEYQELDNHNWQCDNCQNIPCFSEVALSLTLLVFSILMYWFN